MPDGTWGRPLNAGSPINSVAADMLLGSSADGRQLAVWRKGASSYLDVVIKGDRSWQISGSWPLPVFTAATFDFEARKLVFAQPINEQRTDLFTQYALPNGKWSDPEPLALNTEGVENQPYLAADGQSLYFKQNGEWMLSRFDAKRKGFISATSLKNELPSHWQEITVSVVRPDRVIASSASSTSLGSLTDNELAVVARPLNSKLIRGKVNVVQSPQDRINGTSIRLLVGGRERQVYPNREGEYTIVVPTDQQASIVAEAPGYFSPTRTVNRQQSTDLSIAANDELQAGTYSDAYYQRETQLRELHRSIAVTREELADLQEQRQSVSQSIREQQLAAGRDVLAGFSDPELEKLRAQLQTVQTDLRDTMPPTTTPKGAATKDDRRKPTSFDDLDAMKAKFRAQQEARLAAEGKSGYEWRDKEPESLRRDLEKVLNEDLIPNTTRNIATSAYEETPVDSLAMEQNIRQSLFSTNRPAVYERQSWENELISNLPAETQEALEEKLREPVRAGVAREQEINSAYKDRQQRLAKLQDSLNSVINLQLAEESSARAVPPRQFTAKGGDVTIAAPSSYAYRPITDVALIPLTPGSKMVLNQIQFASNGAHFKSTAYVELDRLAKLLLDNPFLNIRIEAHVNATLSYLTALELSEQRAAAVVEYLMSKNISINRLQFKGYGRQYPITEQNTPAGRIANQRIELLILD